MGLFQSLWHPHFEKEKFGHRQANGKNTDVFKPRRGAWFRFSFEAIRRKQPRWHLDCGLLASRIGTIHFCGISPSAGGPLLWQMLWGTDTGRVRSASAASLTVSINTLRCPLVPLSSVLCPLPSLTREGQVMSSELQWLSGLSAEIPGLAHP